MYGLNVHIFNRVVSIQNRCYSSSSSKKLLEILADMPKPTSARIALAQRQRQQISKKSEKYGPSTVYLQVLGSGAKGAPNTLYLFTDQKRYMFNCGECTQRLAHEHKVRLSKLDHVFITTKTWKNIGGLPGMSLTLQDVGVPSITLHGPKGLDELYNATKRFVIMKDMQVKMATCSSTEDFEDSVMTVKYVLLDPCEKILDSHNLKHSIKKSKTDSKPLKVENEFSEFINDDTDYYFKGGRNFVEKDKAKSKVRSTSYEREQLKKAQTLQPDTSACSVAYICTLKKRLGTLDLAKCVELGVKPGPLLGQLKSGLDVILPNGNRVLSTDVKTPDDPGPVFIVLDVPDVSYIKEDDFKAHFAKETNAPENVPVLIVHFTPPHVLENPAYTNFIQKFGPTTQHLVLNSKNSCLGSEAVHRTQHKLHLLDADIFPLLKDVSVPAVWDSQPFIPKSNNVSSEIMVKGLEELKNKIAFAQFQSIISLERSCKSDASPEPAHGSTHSLEWMPGRTLTMFHLRPKIQIDRSAEPKLHIQDYIQETMNVEGFVDSKEKFSNLVNIIKKSKSSSEEYPKVVFLGTGSCIPSKTRNTSAIMLHIDEERSMLLDCGEGTYGQLVRFYGPKKVNAVLRTIKGIYISHLHADHHIGLFGVLQGRREAFEELPEERHLPVYLLAPGQIVTWLTLYDRQFEPIKDNYTLIPNQTLLADAQDGGILPTAALAALGVVGVRTCLVPHCPNAFGVAVQTRAHKITYSGDTLPCTDLVNIGQDSSILIHEATMEDALAEEARTKMHSTTSQAIEVGRQMRAAFTVLTHFSQRYARLPRLNATILNDNHTVGIAFDNMQIRMDDLKVLPHMYAPLQLMFAEHCVELELKAAHREQQREKRESSPTSLSGTMPKRSREYKDNTQIDDNTNVKRSKNRSRTKSPIQVQDGTNITNETSETLTQTHNSVNKECTHTDSNVDISIEDSVGNSVKISGS